MPRDAQTHGEEGPVRMEAEIGVTQLQPRNSSGAREPPEAKKQQGGVLL